MIEQKVSSNVRQRTGEAYSYQRHHKGRQLLGELRHYRDQVTKKPVRIYYAHRRPDEAAADGWRMNIETLRFMRSFKPDFFAIEFKKAKKKILFVMTWRAIERYMDSIRLVDAKQVYFFLSRTAFVSNDADRESSTAMTTKELMIGRK